MQSKLLQVKYGVLFTVRRQSLIALSRDTTTTWGKTPGKRKSAANLNLRWLELKTQANIRIFLLVGTLRRVEALNQ